MSEAVMFQIGQTWIGCDWKKTILKFNPKSLRIRTRSIEPFGSDWTSAMTREQFSNWIERSRATLDIKATQ